MSFLTRAQARMCAGTCERRRPLRIDLAFEDFREKFLRCRPRRGARGSCWDAASPNTGLLRSGPLQALEDRASHHPVLVALRKEAQLLREMGDALAVGGFGKRVRQVGPPVAALRAVGVEQAADVRIYVPIG